MPDPVDLLSPRPRRIRPGGEPFEPPDRLVVGLTSDHPGLAPAAEWLFRELSRHGLEPRLSTPGAAAAGIRLAVGPAGGEVAESYRLRIDAGGVEIRGRDEAGLFYGVVTLAQWLALHAGGRSAGAPLVVPGLAVDDAPAIAHRGVLLDISRNRVPTRETLFELVDRLASWKINQLQLYTEHTFAYRGHEVVWRGTSPLTAGEVKELDRYCARRFIELVPNQNSFGHLHRWLVHEPYRRLAERPEGVKHPWSDVPEPFSLCPIDPGSLELLADLYDQLLPQFTSRQMNAGFDETFDLGTGRSAEACQAAGKDAVYLGFLRQVRQLLFERGRRMQFWADALAGNDSLVRRLPADVVPLVWGYEADHPFAEECAPLAENGLDFYVCPGTSTWNSFGGRMTNALANLSSAARVAVDLGATGYLVTDWGDHGHLQPPAVSRAPLMAAAAAAWSGAGHGGQGGPGGHVSVKEDGRASLARRLDLWAFDGGSGLGAAALRLADVDRATGAPIRNGTVLGRLVLEPGDDLDHARYSELTVEGLEQALSEVAETRAMLARVDPPNRGGGRTANGTGRARRELLWVAAALDLAARVGLARFAARRSPSTPPGRLRAADRRRLAEDLGSLDAELARLWPLTSRPGGLAASRSHLMRLETRLSDAGERGRGSSRS